MTSAPTSTSFHDSLRTRWPDCDAAKLSQLASEDAPPDPSTDFLLSRACLAGSDSALAALERDVIAPVVAQLRATTKDAVLLDEAAQQVRIRLLVDGKLAGYRGRGALGGFVRVAISRAVVDLLRKQQRERTVSIEPWQPLLTDSADTELATLRKTYGDALTDAVGAAWNQLAPDDRLILGMQLHEACGVQHIARLYGIHRTSAARRLVAARGRLLERCRQRLRDDLGTSEATLDSIIRAFASSSAWTYFHRDVDSLFDAINDPATVRAAD